MTVSERGLFELGTATLDRELRRTKRKLGRVLKSRSHFPRYLARQLLHRMRTPSGRWTDRQDGKYVLYRILGNDLEPRHGEGQTLRNLEFILEHEPGLARCQKRWLLNRIRDRVLEQRIITLIESAGHSYTRLEFRPDEYLRIDLDLERFGSSFFDDDFSLLDELARYRAQASALRLKNLYAMNNNGARNAALEEGRAVADWILPWDGNCFVTAEAWNALTNSVHRKRHLDYHIVPMVRLISNDQLFARGANFKATDEPQIVFHRTARETFNPELPYGRRPKVELLSRLGVRGPWDSWTPDPWDLQPRAPSQDRFLFNPCAGWVARLASGKPQLEHGKAGADRAHARNEAIIRTLIALDEELAGGRG